jgi:hypothetical protein
MGNHHLVEKWPGAVDDLLTHVVRAWPCQPCPACCWGSPNWINATPVFVAKNHGEARLDPMGAPPLLPPN